MLYDAVLLTLSSFHTASVDVKGTDQFTNKFVTKGARPHVFKQLKKVAQKSIKDKNLC